MDRFESLVNQHHDERRDNARNKRVQKHLNSIYIASAVAVVFLIFRLLGLVHPGLASPIVVVALMVGSYHLGRCARFGMRGR